MRLVRKNTGCGVGFWRSVSRNVEKKGGTPLEGFSECVILSRILSESN